MEAQDGVQDELAALAQHLDDRRKPILRAWRAAVSADPRLTAGDALPVSKLHDHIPKLLESFAKALVARPAEGESLEGAATHGLQRWQQGYDLREVTRELGRLHLCLVDELELYERAHPALPEAVRFTARRRLAEQFNECVNGSTAEYFVLQQVEAAGHVEDLQRALQQIRELEQQRSALWRQAAHDLRGNLGVVVTATTGLAQVGAASPLGD